MLKNFSIQGDSNFRLLEEAEKTKKIQNHVGTFDRICHPNELEDARSSNNEKTIESYFGDTSLRECVYTTSSTTTARSIYHSQLNMLHSGGAWLNESFRKYPAYRRLLSHVV
ncbi:hypothetical protein AVEN_70478-1 [Araneus ventricosus]|uniref:Uncharacterized protein n=1 Tax=Araneus ventricosus TaxID=182803 RepID=A0A4Y2H5A8_ARAVE|nr:hypothetical protein AVEN_70478-1 [Araneus ventricosus]